MLVGYYAFAPPLLAIVLLVLAIVILVASTPSLSLMTIGVVCSMKIQIIILYCTIHTGKSIFLIQPKTIHILIYCNFSGEILGQIQKP